MTSKTVQEGKPSMDLARVKATTPIVNPVLVQVGKEILPHQTPVFPWQAEGEACK